MKEELIDFLLEIWGWVKYPIGAGIVIVIVQAVYWFMLTVNAFFKSVAP